MPRIRARVADLGLVPHGLDARLGVTLSALSRAPNHRTVSLTTLVRLSRLLDLPLDDLVVALDPLTRPPGAGQQCSAKPRGNCRATRSWVRPRSKWAWAST
ncbi:hypothetical protein [Saccharothrix obliqua]|uniref:hypothetical protein n=1 Tax=Saccharothrix obliqua TaxID=2861747 RepID=UPI001C5FCF5D|nr:hypothetical protein [Saccharothrix obliqua]MBW4717405.1 hypothetical protein [Saccharothrix obliqua]